MDTTKQYCKGCQKNKRLDRFTEALETCDSCRAKQQEDITTTPNHVRVQMKEQKQRHQKKNVLPLMRI